jgi:hypothetical protein
MVDEVVSSGPGWIVIYTTDAYGQPNQPIGHAAVKDGDNQMVMVPVDPMNAQGTLFAQLHVDKARSVHSNSLVRMHLSWWAPR